MLFLQVWSEVSYYLPVIYLETCPKGSRCQDSGIGSASYLLYNSLNNYTQRSRGRTLQLHLHAHGSMISTRAMSRTQSAPQQRNQTSRKGKKAWRKNVDISDVQDGLEQLRGEILTGYVS